MKQFSEFLKESYLSPNASSELAKAESALVAHREIPKESRAADHHIREKKLDLRVRKLKHAMRTLRDKK